MRQPRTVHQRARPGGQPRPAAIGRRWSCRQAAPVRRGDGRRGCRRGGDRRARLSAAPPRTGFAVMPPTDAIAAIEAGPEGPDIGAFFDFDGTLIDGYSAVAYFADRVRRREMEAVDVVRTALRRDMDENEIAGVIGKAMTEWAGRPEEEL